MSEPQSIDETRKTLKAELQRKKDKRVIIIIIAFSIIVPVWFFCFVKTLEATSLGGAIVPLIVLALATATPFLYIKFIPNLDEERNSNASSTAEKHHPLGEAKVDVPATKEEKPRNL